MLKSVAFAALVLGLGFGAGPASAQADEEARLNEEACVVASTVLRAHVADSAGLIDRVIIQEIGPLDGCDFTAHGLRLPGLDGEPRPAAWGEPCRLQPRPPGTAPTPQKPCRSPGDVPTLQIGTPILPVGPFDRATVELIYVAAGAVERTENCHVRREGARWTFTGCDTRPTQP